MSKKSRRRENSRKKIALIMQEFDENKRKEKERIENKKKQQNDKERKKLENTIKNFNNNKNKQKNANVFPNSKTCKHVWVKHHESEDHDEITFYCDECHIHKTEKQVFEQFKPKLEPHEMKNHGPSETHKDPRKYYAPNTAIILKGNKVQKNEILKRCVDNKKIDQINVNGLDKKIEILNEVIPDIVIDECVANQTLLKNIQEIGYNVCFLGRGLSDDMIFDIVEKQKAILVTEDVEFHYSVSKNELTYDPIFITSNNEHVLKNTSIIESHMKKFEVKE